MQHYNDHTHHTEKFSGTDSGARRSHAQRFARPIPPPSWNTPAYQDLKISILRTLKVPSVAKTTQVLGLEKKITMRDGSTIQMSGMLIRFPIQFS